MCSSIVWFRSDLRLADNLALRAGVRRGGVIPVFIWSPEEEEPWSPGAASRWWLHQSLLALGSDLEAMGSGLVIRRGRSAAVLRRLVEETGVGAVFWNRRYEPAAVARDGEVEKELGLLGVEVETFNAALLSEPWEIQNKSGKPFQVFTPFWKCCLASGDPEAPVGKPRALEPVGRFPDTLAVGDLGLEAAIDWAAGMRAEWRPGEAGARGQLRRFLGDGAESYEEGRNRPDRLGTSRLSPHLHFGEISPRQIWHAFRLWAERSGVRDWRSSQFLAEVGWREFSHHLLHHFPETPAAPLREVFRRFRWRTDRSLFRVWCEGKTGYPIVDAGMRELWGTGWMHNRVRMIVASFLVKDLLISWEEGARWFWDTLVDADLAQNTLGWQWTAGCGADAAPYFRVFNPVSQGEKFDPGGDYVRRWCPELGQVPDKWLHRPWEAPAEVLVRARVRLGETYPEPAVSHAIAREVALEAFARLKKEDGA